MLGKPQNYTEFKDSRYFTPMTFKKVKIIERACAYGFHLFFYSNIIEGNFHLQIKMNIDYMTSFG